MKTKPTHAEQDAVSKAYIADLHRAPKFTTIEKMEEVSLALRRILVQHYPSMRQVFEECGFKL